MITIKPKFERKLKKLKIKTKFLNNVRKYTFNTLQIEQLKKYTKTYYGDKKDIIKMKNRWLGSKNWLSFIATAFVWYDTPEGHDYWYKISRL
jgi:hypothetical protein